ncbi:MAG: terminase small subunit [Oscillospiraceae bacterium]
MFLIAKLTEKQKRFCEEYLIDLNGTRAYMAAYSCKKEDTARVNASRMLTNANIQDYISELMKQQSERTGITADKVLTELEKVAFADTEISGKEKIKALELLGKHLGMFSEKVDIEADIGVQIIDDIPKTD